LKAVNPPKTVQALRGVYARLLRKILVRDTMNRARIGEEMGCSLATVTHYTRWLLENGLLVSKPTKVPNIKRPVDELRINGEAGLCVSATADLRGVTAQLIRLDGTVVETFGPAKPEATQAGFVATVSEVVWQAVRAAKKLRKPIFHVGFGVDGWVSSDPGIVFHVEGIAKWEACRIGGVLPDGQLPAPARCWAEIACKVRGLAAEMQVDDRLCYVEFVRKQFHLAAIQDGVFAMGSHGTGSARMHQKISDRGPRCYCGRVGCLTEHVKRGDVDPDIVFKAFLHLFDGIPGDVVGLEWDGPKDWFEKSLLRAGAQKVHHVKDATELALRGVAHLTAEMALAGLVDRALQREQKGAAFDPLTPASI
jgi:hypothetical protein